MPTLKFDFTDARLYVAPWTCKYYTPRMETIKAYVECLYSLEECSAGGLLHILTDDNNICDKHILHCLNECIKHPEREESQIGKLICEEYLKLSMKQRARLVGLLNGFEDTDCYDLDKCENCPCMYAEPEEV